MIFFFFHSKSATQITKGLQQYYQVEIDKEFYLIDPEPCTANWLVNFVSCAIKTKSAKDPKYAESPRVATIQKMHIPNCDFSFGNDIDGRVIKTRYRFSHKVIRSVCLGEELLMLPTYSGYQSVYATKIS